MSKYRYGVILDAGSSGTRVHIYRWLKTAVARATSKPEDLHRLPLVKTKNKKWTMKVHPGISSFAGQADLVGPDHLKELFDFALDVVPKSEVESTPIFLLATAGMRLLDEMDRKALLREVCTYAKAHTSFSLTDCDEHVQVITGETEGLYGWIASNYLVGGFDSPEAHKHLDDHSTYGFLDMGGASAQIAFAPNSTETEKHAEDLQLLRLRNVDGTSLEYKVFVTTFLGYGANEARRRFIEDLEESHETDEDHKALPDPCLPAGLELTKDLTIIHPDSPEGNGDETYLLGTGQFSSCVASTYHLLDKDAVCTDAPCLFHGVHVPAIDFNINHFIGVSNFWHGTHEIFEMGYKDHAYDFATYQKRVSEFCGNDWATLEERLEKHEWGDKIGEEEAAEACFKAAWIINILHEGIGVPRVGLEATDPSAASNGTEDVISSANEQGYLAPFQAVNKIDDTEVEWTMGKMLLYASSQIPPADTNMLDVGFGTNDPNAPLVLPADFQRGGSQPDVFKPVFSMDDYGGDNDDDNDDEYEVDNDNNDTEAPSTFPGAASAIPELPPNWRTKLLTAAESSGRTPGYILFGLLLVVVCILLCGRDRRANILHKLSHPFSRGGGGLSSTSTSSRSSIRQRRGGKLPFGLSSAFGGGGRDAQSFKYERLMEEGELLDPGHIPHPSDFELRRVGSEEEEEDRRSDSSATSSGSARKGGAVTPRRGVVGSPFTGAGGLPSASLDGVMDEARLNSRAAAGADGQGLGLGLPAQNGRGRGGFKDSID